MAYCLATTNPIRTRYEGNFVFTAVGGWSDYIVDSPSAPVGQYGVPASWPWAYVYVIRVPSGLSDDGSGCGSMVISMSEWSMLRELNVINQTLKDELAATRTKITEASTANVAQIQATQTSLSLQQSGIYEGAVSRFYETVDYFGVTVVLACLLAGFFFGFRWARGSV